MNLSTNFFTILLSKIYEFGINWRLKNYNNGTLDSYKLDVPVISIGNITVGGTGKTPMTIFLANYLSKLNYKIGILTRGYKRTSKGLVVVSDNGKIQITDWHISGDEPKLLAYSCPNASVIVCADRVSAGKYAIEKLDCNLFLLDDGYQHLRLQRDCNILLIDATNPFGSDYLLPAGLLREPLEQIKRADIIIITKTNLANLDKKSLIEMREKLEKYSSVPIFLSSQIPLHLHFLKDNSIKKLDFLQGKDIISISALGNPQAFEDSLIQLNANIIKNYRFRDHHSYTKADLDKIIREMREKNINIAITTSKDAIRLPKIELDDIDFYILEIEMQIENFTEFTNLLYTYIQPTIYGF